MLIIVPKIWEEFISSLPQRWQDFYSDLPPMCSRELVAKKSQIVASGTLANLDITGEGIPNGRLVGKKICYPKEDVLIWLLKYSGEEFALESIKATAS